MRGRHFGFLGTLCSIWIAARVGFLLVLSVEGEPLKPPPLDDAKNAPKTQLFAAASAGQTPRTYNGGKPPVFVAARSHAIMKPAPNKVIGDGIQMPALSAPENIFSPAQMTEPSNIIWLPALPARQKQSGLNVYAYSFFRQSALGSSLARGGQYGGSQSGFVATYTLARSGDESTDRLALQLRGAIAHGEPSERELAAGLRWQPLQKVPVTLTAERRFRNGRPDAFAAYLAGGKSQVSLPLKFRLDAFAQGGLVSGRDGGIFFDAAARAERKLATIGKTPITFGGAIWGGGQEDIFRVDVGPTIGTEVPLGKARLRINADWRFRIAGDTQPASGPALTLSTSF